MRRIFLLFALFCSVIACRAQSTAERLQLSSSIERDLLSNVLPFWLEHEPDTVQGGFYGQVSREGQGRPDAPLSAILSSRILWTFSAAYRLYGRDEYRSLADRMQQYYLAHLVDSVYGGVYWDVTPQGEPHDALKQSYATAFGIYALSEHYRATGSMQSLEAAQQLFLTLESRVHDDARGGYREAFTRDYSSSSAEGVDGRIGPSKTMNTHIHLLEGYTNLYRVWPDDAVRQRLVELIGILQQHLYNPSTGHLILFCDDDWHAVGEVDSYGHDIETSWLLTEAAEALGDESLLASVRQQALRMTDAALADGMTPDGVMVYERDEKGLNLRQAWWVQCETVVGCLNAWQITGEARYFEQALQTWSYIQQHFVDQEYGEWFRNLDAEGHPNLREPKASQWNCPYHNSRMAYEAVRRLNP